MCFYIYRKLVVLNCIFVSGAGEYTDATRKFFRNSRVIPVDCQRKYLNFSVLLVLALM